MAEEVFTGSPGRWGGWQPASRCVLIRSLTIRQQLLKYANRPILGKDWEMGVFACSLCVEPWGDSWLRTAFCLLQYCGTHE